MKQTLSTFGDIILAEDVKDRSVPGREHVVSAIIRLTDGTTLVAREYTFYDTGRSKYSYHWMTGSHQLIHRWDNAHEVPLPTSPFHQHIGSEENVQPSEPMTLAQVLTIIAQRLEQES